MTIPHVLVVDDDADRALPLVEALRLHGFRALGATSLQAVTPAAEAAQFDFAIVEMMLNGTHGFNLARALRTHQPTTRVMLVSEYEFTETQLSKVDCGAMAFVARPFSVDMIVEFIRQKLHAAALAASEQAP
jgi:DNA-binding response OmpR family regulator